MLFDGIPYAEYVTNEKANSRLKTILPFIDFLEKKTGAKVLFDNRQFPMERSDLSEPMKIGGLLKNARILDSFYPVNHMPDEPPLKLWGATCSDPGMSTVGGGSVDDDEAALYATLAEGLERYLWFTQTDHFLNPIRATVQKMSSHGAFLSPDRFVSFTETERRKHAELQISADTSFTWIQGVSLLNRKKVYVPAQVVSGISESQYELQKEPLICARNTIGLATWPTLTGARLAGAAEVIERDAYMIMWLNQLTLPRMALTLLRTRSSSLDVLIEKCERYRLKIHAIQMLTDAPIHAVCAIVEDMSGHAPRFSVGLKAHRSLAHSVEKATLEALRMRQRYRSYFATGNTWDPNTPLDKIGHSERMYYWGDTKNASGLEFLIQGKENEIATAEWENDTEVKHLERILRWCREKNYECVSVSIGSSKKNLTPWHVEMVAMPDLQPTYLVEWRRQLAGNRLKSVPALFGYTAREDPFIDAPHPLC